MKDALMAVPFSTNTNRYVYDGVTSEIIPSSKIIDLIISCFFSHSKEEIYQMSDNITQEEFEHIYAYVSSLISSGMFYLREKEEAIEKPIKEGMLDNSGSQLIFVLTEKCNMRCEYCVYSDKYPKEMGYSDMEMDFKVAQKAIDEFLRIHEQRVKHGYKKAPFICFYGGEPLLKMELIKQIVEYIEAKQVDAMYYITTNGLLLDREKAEFLSSHNFNITFSLDGFKENHDRNRVTAGGQKTFDLIYNNIKNLQRIKKEKNVTQIISFNCCYDNYTNIYECIKFFENNYDLFAPFYCVYAPVKPYDTSYYDWVKTYMQTHDYSASEDEFRRSLEQVRKEFFSKDKGNERFREVATSLFVGYYTFAIRNKWVCAEYNNSCNPLDKLAVYPDGNYALCEKMNGKLPIGNVDEGLDYDRIEEIAKRFKENFRSKECKRCPVRLTCSACFMYMDAQGDFDKEFCEEQKRTFASRLSEIYTLRELGIDFIEMININKSRLELLEAMK